MLLAHNYACLAGQLTRNQISEVNGSPVCNLALNYLFYHNREPHQANIAVSLWGETALAVHQQYLVGSQVQMEGYLQTELVERTDGKKQSVVSLVASYVYPTAEAIVFNRVLLVGQTGAEPTSRYLESGAQVVNLSLAVNRASKTKTDTPDWFALEMWGKTAEVCAVYAPKGSRMSVVGSLVLDTWKDKETGHQRFKPVVQVQSIRLLTNKQGSLQDVTQSHSEADLSRSRTQLRN